MSNLRRMACVVGAVFLAIVFIPHTASADTTRAESTYKVDILSSPKEIGMYIDGKRNCDKALKARVKGPALSEGERMSLRTTVKIVSGGPQVADDPFFTEDVRPGQRVKIFPNSVDICGFVAGALGQPGTYRVKITIDAVVRSGSVAALAATRSTKIKVNYSGAAG